MEGTFGALRHGTHGAVLGDEEAPALQAAPQRKERWDQLRANIAASPGVRAHLRIRALIRSYSTVVTGPDPRSKITPAPVDLYWIPLGAGHHSVRFNGMVFEAIAARLQHRTRAELYHAALQVGTPEGLYSIEMTPIPDSRGEERGVVAEGPVGARWVGRLRIFRYEIRRWCNGVIPDLDDAVASPVRLANDLERARAILELVPSLPTPVWGRDELDAGDMWNSNSVVSWLVTRAGLDPDSIALPRNGRAPGWPSGVVVARRQMQSEPTADTPDGPLR